MSAGVLKIGITANPNDVVFPRNRHTYTSTFSTFRYLRSNNNNNNSHKFSSTNHKTTNNNNSKRFQPIRIANSNQASASDTRAFDVIVVGAGIVGLTIARHFLLESNLSVAVVDAAVPCSGATGAGQGYIWRVHKTPGSEKWELSMRSHHLWEALAESVRNQGLDPVQTLGWKRTGSMLVGTNAADCSVLRSKVEQLVDAGVGAEFLCRDGLQSEEPALKLGEECGAAFVRDDCQLDARRAVAFLEKVSMPGGKPVIGPVPGLSKMFLAAGHEGEGLSLALGTAEMIFNMVLGNPQEVNPAPYSL